MGRIFDEENIIAWRRCVFEIFWNHSYAFHIMKSDFKLCSYRKFQVFQKVLGLHVFDWSNLSLDQLKNVNFEAKTLCLFRFMFDSFWSIETSFKIFWSLLDSSRPIEFHVFFWNKRNQTSSFQTLSSSSQFLYTQFLFLFLFFFESKLQVFFPQQLVRPFYPSFLIKLHAYMHFYQIFQNFRTKGILRFLMILSVLI